MNWLDFLYGILYGSGDCLVALGVEAILTIVGTAITAATAATSAGIGAARAKDAREAERQNRLEAEEERQKRENLFARRYYQDVTERTEVQAMMRELRERNEREQKRNEAKNAVLGATKQQEIAQQDSLNKSYAEGIGEMTRNASQLRDGYLNQYENSLSKYYDNMRASNTKQAEMAQQNANSWAQAGANATGQLGESVGDLATIDWKKEFNKG